VFFASLSRFPAAASLQLLTDWATGRDCYLCAAPARALLCGPCEASLPSAAALDRCLRAPFEYRFPLDRLVQRFKFAGDLALGRYLGERLAACVADEAPPDLLVAPPLATPRLRTRGFNQSVELARYVGRRLHLRVAADALEKTRETLPQQGLGRRARRRNLRGAFRCRANVRGLRIALVDDVYTTGATAREIGDTLRRAGAREVVVWAVARAPGPR